MSKSYLERAKSWVEENPDLKKRDLEAARSRVLQQLSNLAECAEVYPDLRETADYLAEQIEAAPQALRSDHIASEDLAAGVEPDKPVPHAVADRRAVKESDIPDIGEMIDSSPLVDHGAGSAPKILSGAERQAALASLIGSGLVSKGFQ